MKTYILKQRNADGPLGVYLYDGTTRLSNEQLTTLFATAGSAYFVFDFDGHTITDKTAFSILNSNDTGIMSATGLTGVQEDKNFKGTWEASATTFTSFELLKGMTMDEAQLSKLAGISKEGKIITLTTADYDYPSDNPTAINANGLGDGIYIAGEQISVRLGLYANSTFSKGGMIIKSDGNFLAHLGGANSWVWKGSFSEVSLYNLLTLQNLANNLTSTDATKALSAPQGKVLNDNIGDLTTLTTTDKTSAVAAINELATRVALLEGGSN